MDTGISEMPCKMRKRRLPSSSFANNNQLLIQKTPYDNGLEVDRGICKKEESKMAQGLNELVEKSITNVDRSRNKSRNSPCLVYAPQIINKQCRGSSTLMGPDESGRETRLIYDTKLFKDKSRHADEVEIATMTKSHRDLPTKPSSSLDEINHSLTISKEVIKVLAHIWTTNTNHNHHPTSTSLVSALNLELDKARSHVNKLIQEQQTNTNGNLDGKYKEHVNVCAIVKTVARELEVERKLRRQTERMNKKLGRELANTKYFLSKAIKKIESDKQEKEILQQLCEEMAQGIEEDRVKLEEIKKESVRLGEEMEEEREMLRVADMLREERVQMKLSDAKYEYENKNAQVNTLIHELGDILEVDSDGLLVMDHLKISKSLLWYQNNKNDEGEVVIDENTIVNETASLLWYQNEGNGEGKIVNDESIGLLKRCNSDCIEWELKSDKKKENEDDSNECLKEKVLGFPCLDEIKEYEDEMERYKMIKDLRDHIVSGSGLTLSQGFVMLQETTQGQ